MNIFELLAQSVDKQWSKAGCKLELFPLIATSALESFKYNLTLDQLNTLIADWLLKHPTLPDQMNVYNAFGQPPVTLFNNGKFVVDLYFWVNFDTSIHSHGFRGAFKVLHGCSLQEDFLIKNTTPLANDLMLVDLNDVRMDLVKAQDVHTIAPGLDLTHRVIHLENPTITLCVKTINEPELKQWTYLSTGLAVQKQNTSASVIKKIYYFQYLFEKNQLEAENFWLNLTEQLDISTQIHIYEDIASGAYSLNPSAYSWITENFVERHQTSQWWPLYETSHLERNNELFFEDSDVPAQRLLAHFINRNLKYKDITEILKHVSTQPTNETVFSLIDVESIFNIPISEDDRQIIKELVVNPSADIPVHLIEIQQIQKIRNFLFSN